MLKFLAAPILGVTMLAQACASAPPPTPERVVLGDSDAYLVAQQLGIEGNGSYAEGTCDLGRPAGQHVLIHAGGHSTVVYPFYWYDEATWQSCMLAVIDYYGAQNVWVATAPQPLAIYCAFGVDEYSARLTRANAWKLNVLPTLRPGVHIVRWDDLRVGADCTHFTADQAQIAAQRAIDKGF